MAIQATSQVVYDGIRQTTMQFTGMSDGATGDEVLEVKVDPAALSPPCRFVKIKAVDYDVVGGTLRISWDASTPTTFLDLSLAGRLDYKEMGPVPNPDQTSSGKILFSTLGFDAGASYTIKLDMIKGF